MKLFKFLLTLNSSTIFNKNIIMIMFRFNNCDFYSMNELA